MVLQWIAPDADPVKCSPLVVIVIDRPTARQKCARTKREESEENIFFIPPLLTDRSRSKLQVQFCFVKCPCVNSFLPNSLRDFHCACVLCRPQVRGPESEIAEEREFCGKVRVFPVRL